MRKIVTTRNSIILSALLFLLPACALGAVTPKDPYIGAIVVDARDGAVLWEDSADAPSYPASVVKLMTLLVVEDEIARGALSLTDPVAATVEATRMGGTQVWLKEKEVFPVEELIYAMIVESANDAAMALAIHVGGSQEGFVEMMNRKAAELGMKNSRFASVHGLPPSRDRDHDITTARDLAIMAVALLKHPNTLKYTSVKERPFRNGTFTMRSHNHLLKTFPGADGLKTGYIKAGGYCIAFTGEKNGVRVVTVVVGSKTRQVRDQQASTLLSKGFQLAPPAKPTPVADASTARTKGGADASDEDAAESGAGFFSWGVILAMLGAFVAGLVTGGGLASRRSLLR